MKIFMMFLLAFSAQAESITTFSAKNILNQKMVQFPSREMLASVVVFLSAKCPCSESHEPVIANLAKEYKNKKIEFVIVHSNQDETADQAKSHFSKWITTHQLDVPVVHDEKAVIANQFKALKTPHAFIVQNNKIIFSGGVDDSANAPDAKKHFLKDALDDLTQGKPIRVTQARALGCQIKR